MVSIESSGNCMCSRNNTKNVIKNNNNNHKAKNKQHNNAYKSPATFTLSLIIGIWCILNNITSIPGAAVYTNVDFNSNPTFEPICNQQEEHFIESDGKESSLILEFNTAVAATQHSSCTRILSAPPNYGFIIRLILPKIRRTAQNKNILPVNILKPNKDDAENNPAAKSDVVSRKSYSLSDKLNTSTHLKASRSCPLSIFSSDNPHTPQWRVDPCQLEDTAPEMEDPVRLFRGRVRILWEHGNQQLSSKLMVTALGKGEECRSHKKHQCLKLGDEPILCISKDLICDGIRHCPYSNEYDSDEDFAMCWKRSRLGEPIPPSMESDIFEHFALEVFRNLFAFDVPPLTKGTTKTNADSDIHAEDNSTATKKIPTTQLNVVGGEDLGGDEYNVTLSIGKSDNASSFLGSHHHRRNGTRVGLNSDLSKYGPWGYLMLGMLLCGGALLICGLWASASQHAANNERESALQSANAAVAGSQAQGNHSSPTAPPNYEELDPPPAYSVLFPNQKAASSNTLSSLDVQESVLQQYHHNHQLHTQQLSPSAAPSSRSSTTRSPHLERAASSSNSTHDN